MIESEAWLKLACEYDSAGPQPTTGLCKGISHIPWGIRGAMRNRLSLFQPFPGAVWFWPANKDRVNRRLRATACGLLAAMAEEEGA